MNLSRICLGLGKLASIVLISSALNMALVWAADHWNISKDPLLLNSTFEGALSTFQVAALVSICLIGSSFMFRPTHVPRWCGKEQVKPA